MNGMQRCNTRFMSSGAHDEAHAAGKYTTSFSLRDLFEILEAMAQWKKISMGAVAFCGVMGVVTVISHFSHAHDDHETPEYSYLKIRTKPFPWHFSDCAFFDWECKRKAKAAEAALSS